MSELQSLSLSDALQMIKRRAGEIDNTRVFICLKRMRFKPVRVKTVEDLKMLIALDEYHLPVTSHLWDSLTDSKGGNSSSSLGILHTLGEIGRAHVLNSSHLKLSRMPSSA